MTDPLEGLRRGHYTVVEIDPPWKFSAGTKSRPQHYPRMTLPQIKDIPVRDLLHPDGGRVLLWITAPLLHRVPELARAWRLRYCTTIPWIKLWPREDGLFIYPDSLARGTGYEVCGNAEYIVILKWRRPQSIKGNPFPGYFMTPRREHSRKPDQLAYEIEQRLAGPFCSVFSRQSRQGWDTAGNERNKFDEVAA
jgi:N6-adenosine-specific RNA methylase IME4